HRLQRAPARTRARDRVDAIAALRSAAHDSFSCRFAISIATSAHSSPLLPWLPPARRSASSWVSTASTPLATGTPWSSATRINASLQPSATCSKWRVSPRTTQPSATIARWAAPAASWRAAIGISQAPGTRTTSIAASSTPWSAKALRAPATSESVIRGFQRLAMIAKRAPSGALRSPSEWLMPGKDPGRGSGILAGWRIGRWRTARESRACADRPVGRPGSGAALWRYVLHDFQPESRQAHLPPRRPQHAQPAETHIVQDLRTGAVAAPFADRAGLAGFRDRSLLADARQQRVRVVRLVEQHQHAGIVRSQHRQHVAGRQAEVAAPPVQRVGQQVVRLHAYQRGTRGIGRATHHGEVQRVADAVAVGHQPERAMRRVDDALVDALDGVFGFKPVSDKVLERTDLQSMLAREHFQLRTPRHAAVGNEDIHQYADRLHL